jgi:hypothetical protein
MIEDLLKKYGSTPEELETVKTEAGDYDLDKAAQLIKTKAADVLRHDDEFIQSIVEPAVKKAEEKVIVATKSAKKAFKQLAGIELSNAEIDSLSIEDLYKTGLDKLKTSQGTDKEALHAEIQKLNAALEAEREAKESEITKVKTEYEKKQEQAIIDKQLTAELSAGDWITTLQDVNIIFNAKLQADGISLKPVNGVITPFKGDKPMMKKDGIQRADLAYLFETMLGSLKKQSNGSGGNGKPNRNFDGDLTEEQRKKLSPTYLAWRKQQSV